MRWLAWLVALVALGSTALAPAAAQEPTGEPPVEIEEADLSGLVVPLGAPAEATFEVRVGCDATETPQTLTRVHVKPGSLPEWANLVVSPSTLSWMSAPGDCPSTGTPYRANVTAIVSVTQHAPAYEPVQLPIQAEVVKQPPEVERNRTYGPYNTTVSLTPGYFHLHDVRLEETIQQVAPDETARFEGTVRNLANHETRYVIRPHEPNLEVNATVEPAELVLAPNATGTFVLEVRRATSSGTVVNEVGAVQFQVQGNSTHGLGGEGGTSEVSVLAKFSRSPQDVAQSPAPGTVLALVTVTVGALVLARGRSNGP